jgi:putative transposase
MKKCASTSQTQFFDNRIVAIYWEMEKLGIKPLPSVWTIKRILSRNDLTHRRTGKYEAKGTAHHKLPSLLPNQTHQADLVGPCPLKGPVRFYRLNMVDTATVRCGLYPSISKSGQSIFGGIWAMWRRMGIPNHIQIDNISYGFFFDAFPT